ncbi:N-acetyltransferase [Jannaschia sp. W003]|uniref:GNAT family N-acetyltransferase n=1 Tax=Jannaschia sp. W003 TaxID=2867012 RepID=UPI0021A7329C|nr:GNAT family N-acetyltransferase [Jannaschia sp. W003]UWQ22676.1 GNAT family N-acetyltransferase [Jannaschia sp. W003]
MAEVAIRPAVPADAAAVRACVRAAYAPYVAAIGREPAPMGDDWPALVAAGEVRVAPALGPLLGCIAFRADGPAMLLETVAVHPGAQGRGLGGALIRHCEAEARRLGLASVRLYTNEAMTANLTLYPALGYRETGRREEHGFRRVFFEKRLA